MKTSISSQKPLLLGVMLVLILLVVGFFLMKTKSDKGTQDDGQFTKNESLNEDKNFSVSGTIADLMGLGKNAQCSFSYEDKGYKNSGTMYVSGNKMRGDYKMVMKEKETSVSMIRKDGYTYTWGPDMPEGFMMKDTAVPTIPANNGAVDPRFQAQQNLGMDKKISYSCELWRVDQSRFELPADITFKDFSLMMNDAIPTMAQKIVPTGGANQCAACAQLQGDARTMCEKQLGCK